MAIQFDFITNDKFRSILTTDSAEMYACAKAGAWKAVHILAGSIIEAVIIDYLISEEHVNEEEALKLDFNSAIKRATEEGILSEKTRDLSIVVKNYRNLVHPGRSIRLKEIPDEKNAKIATSLVEIICEDLSARKSSHGYTAPQIISKIRQDFHASAILDDLLIDMPNNELKDLLTKVIPETYLIDIRFGNDEDQAHVLPTLRSLFRIAYERSNEDIQREVALHFVRTLKEDDSDSVIYYSRAFWWADQLKHLNIHEAKTVKKHFFARIRDDDDNPNIIEMISGIGPHLSPKETSQLVDMLVKIICFRRRAKSAASKLLHNEHNTTGNPHNSKVIIDRLKDWQFHFTKTEKPELASIIEDTTTSILLNDIPF